MELFKHQQEALEQTKDLNRVAYYLDMGLGKTFVGSEKMMSFGENFNLVVCQKSKIQDWIDHFKEHYSEHPYMIDVYDLTRKKDIERFISIASSWERYMEMYDETSEQSYLVDNPDPVQYIAIINYELLWRRKQLIDTLNRTDFTMMLDESSVIQNTGANWTKKGVLKLEPNNVILLSGTPTSGKYENLWSQIHLLGWKISEEVYNRQYVNWTKIDMDGFIHKIVDKENPYKNVDRLKSKLREHGAVFMKTEECFDLPEQTFIKQTVPTSKEYWKFMKDCIITIDDKELVGDTTLTKRLYARQLCGQYSEFKLQAFRELLESTQDRLIVFYNFTAEYLAMVQIAEELGRPQSIINGQQKQLLNYEECDNSITFIQYQAGAMGLNLQKANKIIYFTLTDKSELFEQSKKRIHRIGQEQPCFYYILMCKGSVEEVILQTLEMRKDFTDELFNEYERMENNGK